MILFIFSLFMPNYNQSNSSLRLIDTYLSVVQYVRDQPFWLPSEITILKIRKSVFSVFQHFFCGRRNTANLVSCEETQSSSSFNLTTRCYEKPSIEKDQLCLQRTNDQLTNQQWLELQLLHMTTPQCATDIRIKNVSSSSLVVEGPSDV